jgi:rod shape-determining protein MreD
LVGRGYYVAGQTFIVRAAILVALAALLQASLSPFLTLGWVGPKFVILGVVVAITNLRELQALLLGFFGGVLLDALGGEHFGVGALGGILAAAISIRLSAARLKGEARLVLTQAAAVAVYDTLGLLAPILAGSEGPPLGRYLFGGVVPDVLLNALLAYLVGGWLLKLVTTKEERWT